MLDKLMTQKVSYVNKKKPGLLVWDTGAQISFITKQYAKEAGYKRRSASVQMKGVGPGGKKKLQIQYRLLLC